MSISRNALKLVQKSLPQLHLCKNKLVLPPTGHIVRGYMLERTPYKGSFYLWRLVIPLYRVTLNYSTRIANGDYVHLSKESGEESGGVVTSIISDDLPSLEKMRGPEDFLDHISCMIGNDRPNFLFDLAVTYFLVARFDDSLTTLRQIGVAADKTIMSFGRGGASYNDAIAKVNQFRRAADGFAAVVASNPMSALQIVSDWERRNVEEFHLTSTVPEPMRNQLEFSLPHASARVPPPPQPSDVKHGKRRQRLG